MAEIRTNNDLTLIQKYFANSIHINDFEIKIPLIEIAKEGFGNDLCIDISKVYFKKSELDNITKKTSLDIANRKSRVFNGKYKYVNLLNIIFL